MATVEPLTGKARDSIPLCTSRLNIWEGAVRSSKTVASLLAWLWFIRNGPPGNLLMVGRTGDTLKRNIIDALVEMLGPSRCVHNIGTRELHLLGRTIYLSSANDESSASKIQGMTLVGAYGDELSTWPEGYFRMLGTRLSSPGARLYGTSNPDSPLHWLKVGYLDKARTWLNGDGELLVSEAEDTLDLTRFSFRLADNPFLAPDYIAALAAEYTGLWRRRFILGEWVVAEGSVYDMFDPGRHVVDMCPLIRRWICCSLDYGTVNPTHALLIGLGVDRRLYVVAEWRWDSRKLHRQLTDVECSEKLSEWLRSVQVPGSQLRGVVPEHIIVDPSAASFRVQLHRDGYSPTLGDNAVVDGIRQVGSLLGSGRLLIHASCRYLIDEMQGYVWDEKQAAKGIDAPVKVNDHGVDSLRYGIRTTRALWQNALIPVEAPRLLQDTWDAA